MKEKLINSIFQDPWMMGALSNVRDLDLPDCYIGAGFVRNKAWDILHNYAQRTPFFDIDVVFFDNKKISTKYEKEIESKLRYANSKINWEVINQARTHIWHNRKPYKNTEDALSEWVETATCIGIRLTNDNKILITAPHGLEDIKNLILRPVPSLKNIDTFTNRIKEKNWMEKWPQLKILNA